MKTNKVERLKAAGWEVGNAEDFLQLSDEEAKLVALKLIADQRSNCCIARTGPKPFSNPSINCYDDKEHSKTEAVWNLSESH